jgi:hypothetical protein
MYLNFGLDLNVTIIRYAIQCSILARSLFCALCGMPASSLMAGIFRHTLYFEGILSINAAF